MTDLDLHSTASHAVPATRAQTLPGDSGTLLGIFVVSFAVLLLVALCAQLVACPWRSWLPGAEGKSLVGGVKASVYTFMSYLT